MMSQVGRNAACPCGSGLKYKKCCGKSNVIPFNPFQLEAEMEKLHINLIEFAIETYEKDIDYIVFDEIDENIPGISDESTEGYAALLLPWVILHEPILGENTIFDIFSKRKLKQIRNTKVKETFLSWQKSQSAVFEVISIEGDKQDYYTVENKFSKEKHLVFLQTDIAYRVGDYIVGTLADFIHSWQFLFLTTHIPGENIDLIEELVENYDFAYDSINDIFPEWLGELINLLEGNDLIWHNRKHLAVAEKFAEEMEKRNLEDQIIALGILFWNIYCSRHNPTVTKINTYVASLEYFISITLLEDFSITQSSLAKKYSVSPATISKHWNQFADELERFNQEVELD